MMIWTLTDRAIELWSLKSAGSLSEEQIAACSDGVDNDGDGNIDYADGNGDGLQSCE